MSLQNKRKQSCTSKRGKSLESKQRVTFKKQQKNEISVDDILQQTIKSANQVIIAQQGSHRQSLFRQNNETQRSRTSAQYNEASQNQMVEKQRQMNSTKSEIWMWQKIKIEQKRKIKGIKSKIKWTNNTKDSIFMIVRVVLTDNYTRLNQPDYFVEIDSTNVDISQKQQKEIQKYINKIIEQQQSKIDEQRSEIFYWLRNMLINCHNLFFHMRINQKPKSKPYQFKRSLINTEYILYPNPASITWSPHGMLCLSQNKVGTIFKPILGSLHSYRNMIQAPYKFQRFTRKLNQNQDLKMVDQKNQQQQQTEAQFFGWDAKQEINFCVFGKTADDEQIQQSYKNNQTAEPQQKVQKKINKDYEIHKGMVTIPPKIQKIYKRYFHSHVQNIQFEFLQKLKIFAVKSQNVPLQDGILYLIDQIQRCNRDRVTESLIENEFTGYHGVFTKLEKQNSENKYSKLKFERFKYELISQFMQQKIKISPHTQQFIYMKCVLLENQYFRLALQSYFEQNFKRLKIYDQKCQSLGTYDNFDDIKAERLLIKLIEQLLNADDKLKKSSIRIKNRYRKNTQKYDDPDYKTKKYERMQQNNWEMKLMLKGYVKRTPKYLPQLLEVQSGLRILSSYSQEQNQQQKNKSLYRKASTRKQLRFEEQQEEQNKVISTRNVNLNLMPFIINNKIELESFQFNMILNPNQRKNFLQTIIPILWIKDRSIQKFQYKIAKRVIIANSKVINFLQKLGNFNCIWKKSDKNRRDKFLRNIIKQYKDYKQKIKMTIGKNYVAYCQLCMVEFQAYSLEQLLRVTRCQKCKFY